MVDIHRRIILALAECNMQVTYAAKSVPCHYNTIHYQIKRIKAKYTLDPRKFYDLCKLVELAREG